MAKPQQPEIARSGRGATDPASVKSEREGPPTVRAHGETGPVPEDNVPGHHPGHEQDKPSGEAFVQKLHQHAREAREPEPTVAGDALRAAAGALRKVRESLPGG